MQQQVMRTHHTKTKGDLGVAAAVYDLTKKGFIVCQPMTEHAPFDLVAYANGRCLRVQVKYRAVARGVCEVRFLSVWSDRHGVHITQMNKAEVDVICIYCPDTERCYYLDPSAHAGGVKLRLGTTGNNQRAGVLFAENFVDLPERFRHARQDSNLRRPT
jgi:hypothetical protein